MKLTIQDAQLGAGYNEFSRQPLRRALEGKPTQTTGHQGHLHSQIRLAVLDSSEALSEMLDVSAGAAVDGGEAAPNTLPAVSADFRALNAASSSQHVTYIALCARDITEIEELDAEYKPSPWLAKIKTDASGTNLLFDDGGTCFIRRRFLGRAAWVIISIQSKDKKSAEAVQARLKAKASIISGQAAVDHLNTELRHLNVVNIQLQSIGIKLPAEYTNSSDWHFIINKLAELTSTSTDQGPLGFERAPWKGITTDEKLVPFIRDYHGLIQQITDQFNKITALRAQILSAVDFYFAFDDSNENWRKKEDVRYLQLVQAKKELRALVQELQEQLDEIIKINTLTDYKPEVVKEKISDWQQRFTELQEKLPSICQFTPIKTMTFDYHPWEKLHPCGTRRRLGEHFDLKLPPGTDQLLIVVSQTTYDAAGDAPVKKTIKLDLKRKDLRRKIIKENLFSDGRQEFLWELKPNAKAEDFYTLYFASSEKEDPTLAKEPVKLTVTIYAVKSGLVTQSPYGFFTDNRSTRTPTPLIPMPAIHTSQHQQVGHFLPPTLFAAHNEGQHGTLDVPSHDTRTVHSAPPTPHQPIASVGQ